MNELFGQTHDKGEGQGGGAGGEGDASWVLTAKVGIFSRSED